MCQSENCEQNVCPLSLLAHTHAHTFVHVQTHVHIRDQESYWVNFFKICLNWKLFKEVSVFTIYLVKDLLEMKSCWIVRNILWTSLVSLFFSHCNKTKLFIFSLFSVWWMYVFLIFSTPYPCYFKTLTAYVVSRIFLLFSSVPLL